MIRMTAAPAGPVDSRSEGRGAFDNTARSYDDHVVVSTEPIDG